MKLTWVGHSCFKIEKNGYVIVTDPYEDDSVPGYAPVSETADLVLCSHEHSDHNYRRGVRLRSRSGSPFAVETLSSYHDDAKGAKRGTSKIFIISDGENRIAHLGDLGCELEREQKEQLMNLDAVLIPVGGYFTIDAEQAAALVREINPRIIIPMHYRSDADGFGFEVLETVDAFAAVMRDVSFLPVSEIETAEDQPSQVIVLKPANGKNQGSEH